MGGDLAAAMILINKAAAMPNAWQCLTHDG
jgi:hypothetical protein